MAQTQPVKKNRYCWVVFIVCCFASICGVGLFSNTYGLYTTPMAESMGRPVSEVAVFMTVASWVTVAFYVLGTKAFAKWNARWVASIAGFIIACCPFLYAVSTQPWHLYVVAAIAGAGGAFAALNVVPTIITNWFIKYRALAMGIAFALTGVAGAFFNPFFANLITQHGWQYAMRVEGCVAAIFPILAIIFLRMRPSEMGLQPLGFEDSEEMKSIKDQVEIKEFPGVPAKYAFRTAPLYLVTIFVLFNGLSTGFNQHWVMTGVSYGWTLVDASFLATAAMLASAVFKVLGGFLNDKIGSMKTGLFFQAMGIIAMIIMMIQHTHPSIGVIAVCAIIYGFSVALTTMQPPVAIRELFGMRDYLSLYPVANMAMSIGTGLTYSLNAVIMTNTGSYFAVYVFNLVCCACAFVFYFLTFTTGKKVAKKYWREVGEAI